MSTVPRCLGLIVSRARSALIGSPAHGNWKGKRSRSGGSRPVAMTVVGALLLSLFALI